MWRCSWLACLLAASTPACERVDSGDRMGNPGYEVPLLARPLPGHGDDRANTSPQVRPLERHEMLEVARRLYPRSEAGPPSTEHARQLSDSPRARRVREFKRAGYARIDAWKHLVGAVRRELGGREAGYFVMSFTSAEVNLSHVLYIDVLDGSDDPVNKELIVHLSYIIPYYLCYERHSRTDADHRVHESEPIYQLSPELENALERVERAITEHYGYCRYWNAK